MSPAAYIAARFKQASYFSLNDVILYGKWKNHRGRIVNFSEDKWGNPTIEIEPIPKGRKQNKVLGLFKIWRADVKEKALANLVNTVKSGQVSDSTRRIVARYIKAHGIDIGRTVNVGSIRIHRFRDLFTVHDLTNAGKRGKKVKVLRISLGYGSALTTAQREEWFDQLSQTLPNQDTYQGVKGLVNSLKKDDPYVTADETEERGIDVEPTGNKITLKTNTGLLIESDPNDFRVLNRVPLDHPETGKSIGFQDTNYYNKGKDSAVVFFTWLQANLSQANMMSMNDLRNVWDKLNVKYDYH